MKQGEGREGGLVSTIYYRKTGCSYSAHTGYVTAIGKALISTSVHSTSFSTPAPGFDLIWRNFFGRGGNVLYIFTSKMLKFIYANQWEKKKPSSWMNRAFLPPWKRLKKYPGQQRAHTHTHVPLHRAASRHTHTHTVSQFETRCRDGPNDSCLNLLTPSLCGTERQRFSNSLCLVLHSNMASSTR